MMSKSKAAENENLIAAGHAVMVMFRRTPGYCLGYNHRGCQIQPPETSHLGLTVTMSRISPRLGGDASLFDVSACNR
jgi:hypothetical protein